MSFFKDDPVLQHAPLVPTNPVTIQTSWPLAKRCIAATYNRLGGLMHALATKTGMKVEAGLAVWYIESSGRTHTPNQAILRFENHLFFNEWSANHTASFDQHFQFGGRAGIPGKSFRNHKFRANTSAPFLPVHTNQDSEYAALALATSLGGAEAADRSASIGGPQIVGSGFAMLGYASAKAMFAAFQASERAHVLGFFDFCAQKAAPHKGDLIHYAIAKDWKLFAKFYNGPSNVSVYAPRIADSFALAEALPL